MSRHLFCIYLCQYSGDSDDRATQLTTCTTKLNQLALSLHHTGTHSDATASNDYTARTAMPQLLIAANLGSYRGIIVSKLDRLSRDETYFGTLVARLRFLGLEIVSPTYDTIGGNGDILTALRAGK